MSNTAAELLLDLYEKSKMPRTEDLDMADYAAEVLLNALPQLAAVCAAAEKMRANAFGGPCPCESPVCTSLRALDAALADLTAALGEKA